MMKAKLSMNRATYRYRTQQLVHEIMQHPHKDELLSLCNEQIIDDTGTYTCTDSYNKGSKI